MRTTRKASFIFTRMGGGGSYKILFFMNDGERLEVGKGEGGVLSVSQPEEV